MSSDSITLEETLALPDEELRVRVAEIAGLDVSKIGLQFHFCPQCGVEVDANHGFEHQIIVARHKAPDYHNSHDALAPVLAAMSDLEYGNYRRLLWMVVDQASQRAYDQATPRLKCVALILAKI